MCSATAPSASRQAPSETAPAPARPAVSVEALFAEHCAAVWRMLRRFGVREPNLDDALQDVFLVVHRRHAELDTASTPRALLAGIALRVAKDYRRVASRRGTHEELSAAREVAAAGPGELDAKLEAAQLAHAILDELDEDKRTIIVLAELEGLTGPELAEVLKVNLNTTYSRLRAARRAFNDALARRTRGEP